MSETFDPYRKWLGISPRDQPPHHYRLLGIDLFEPDQDVISHAADARMVHLKTFQAGKYSKSSQQILNEVAAAKICLLNSEKKAAYDRALSERLQANAQPAPAVSPPVKQPPIKTVIRLVESPTVASNASARKNWQIAVVAGVAGLVLVVLLVLLATSGDDKPIAQKPKPPAPESQSRSPEEKPKARPNRPKPAARPTQPEFEARNEDPPPVDTQPPVEEPAKPEPAKPEPAEPEPTIRPGMMPTRPGMVPPRPGMPGMPGTGTIRRQPTTVPNTVPNIRPMMEPEETGPDQPSTVVPARPEPLAVPDEAARRVAAERVRTIFKDEFSSAKDRQHKLALAEKLFGQAKKTADDPAARFVMFQLACDLAAESGELTSTLLAVDRIGEEYEIDSLQMKGDLLSKAVSAARGMREVPSYSLSVVQNAMAVIDEAIERDDYDAADRFAKMALPAARKTKDAGVIRVLSDRSREIKRLKQRFAKIQDALNALAGDAENGAANLAAGKWHCFDKGDWDKGLPLLAKGTDPALAALAARDMAGADDPKGQVELGDLWWELPESEEATSKVQRQSRAAYWYERALSGLSGLPRTQVEKRLLQVDSTAGTRKRFKPSHYLLFDGRESYVIISSFRYDGSYPITLEAIVVPTRSYSSMAVIGNLEQGGIGLELSRGEWQAEWRSQRTYVTLDSDKPALLNRRAHIAVTVDGRQIRLYVNGRQQQETFTLKSGHRVSPLPFFVGAHPRNDGTRAYSYFKGIMEEVRISKSAKYGPDFVVPQWLKREEDSLVLLRFYQGRGNEVRDESGNGHNGTIKNPQWVQSGDPAAILSELEQRSTTGRSRFGTRMRSPVPPVIPTR